MMVNLLLLLIFLVQPAELFEDAVARRADANRARPQFAVAAKAYSDAWEQGDHSPNCASNWCRAATLSGDLGAAVFAARCGLRTWPTDATLQRELELVRDRVPQSAELRLPPPRGWQHRTSAEDRFGLFALSTVLVAIGLGRRATTQDRWSVPLAVVGCMGVLLAGFASWQAQQEWSGETVNPVVVIRSETVLRTGNSERYPARLAQALTAGSEAREIHRRRDWVQVQCANGVIGWLPGRAIRIVE